MIILPKDREGKQIKEVSPEWVFSQVESVSSVEIDGYVVYLDALRYKLFKQQRACVVCGIIGNRMFLEPLKDMEGYGFMFYAETKRSPSHETFLVSLTVDHIMPKSRGGTYSLDNVQTLCVNCNWIKRDTEFTSEQIRALMFAGYRAHQSSIVVRLAKERLSPVYEKLKFRRRNVETITKALANVSKEEIRQEMQKKIQNLQETIQCLEKTIQDIELKAQVTGIIEGIDGMQESLDQRQRQARFKKVR